MKDLDLYKFVTTNDLEYHTCLNRDFNTQAWMNEHNIEYSKENCDILLFVPDYFIVEWKDLLGESIFAEEGLECTMKYGYICFWMEDICNYFGITMYEVFKFDDKLS